MGNGLSVKAQSRDHVSVNAIATKDFNPDVLVLVCCV